MSSLLNKPTSSYQPLSDLLSLHKGIPYDETWSAAADFLELIARQVLSNKPLHILECGSGLTTLVLAKACQMSRQGHVYTLENGQVYAETTEQIIDSYALNDYVTVMQAPLMDYPLGENTYQWYPTTELPAVEFDMFVIDGPAGFIQKHSRYPALPLMQDRMAAGCRVFLDDAARDDEKELVTMWQEEFPNSEFEYLEFERGCSKGQFFR